MEEKKCNKCREILPVSGFYSKKVSKDGLMGYCKKCVSRTNKEYRKKYKKQTRKTMRNWHLRSKYGITLEEYDVMLEEQNGVCYICGLPPLGYRLAVDHDHEKGRVRKLLCSNCNRALGFAKENTDTLKKLISYIEQLG